MANGKQRSSLQSTLDKEVYQVVRKFHDELPEDAPPPRSVHEVYLRIQKSNSTLKRKPKQLLQNSIDRVLSVLAEDQEDSEDMGSMELDPEELKLPERTPGGNFMNKSIVGAWASSGATTPAAMPEKGEKPETKKRDATRHVNGEPAKKKQRKTEVDRSPPTAIRLEDIGGVDNVMSTLKKHLILPLLMPEEYVLRHASIPRGILLHGPPGCGKTVISKAFAAELGVPFVEIQGPSIVSGMSGESEQKVRDLFEEARRLAPCLIFIDEIDVIAPKRDTSQSQMEKRIVAQLLISMDSLAMDQNDGKPVIVLAATNRPDSIDPALRRGGRFGTEINMGVPNEKMREQILRALTRQTPVAEDVDFSLLAKRTPGFVGADIRDLVDKATEWSMDQFRKALEEQAAALAAEDAMDVDAKYSPEILSIKQLVRRARAKDMERPLGFDGGKITMQAFMEILPEVQPSSKREGFATIPDTTWDDIGALQEVRSVLEELIVSPIQHPERYIEFGIDAPSGVLLFGPPGCGKTLLAQAVANESKANFISVKSSDVMSKFVGDSERAVRQVFNRARSSIPCVLFFDELDGIVPKRQGEGQSEASSRVVNTFLTELDGVGGSRDGIYIIAATNRPDTIDPAMMRSGRLGNNFYVGLPNADQRVEILRARLRKTKINPDLAECARDKECNGYTGADLDSLKTHAGLSAMRRKAKTVERKDFERAMKIVAKSVDENAMTQYQRMKEKYGTNLMSAEADSSDGTNA